ncbi:MAG: hypothetical protein KIT36_05690 [Alphaproteobacteria bacterium]|nr:hypothetical protein [Alphaproteobacteria bacterium]
MAEPEPDAPRPMIGRNAARAWLVGTQVTMAVLLIFWLPLAGLSIMAFDAPQTPDDPWPLLFVGSIWSWPPVAFVFSLVAWLLCWRYGRNSLAVLITTLPLVFPLAFGLVVLLRS